MSRVTVRDLFAGAIALISLGGIVLLAVLGKPTPDVLPITLTAAVAYFYRGAENGGLTPLSGRKSE